MILKEINIFLVYQLDKKQLCLVVL